MSQSISSPTQSEALRYAREYADRMWSAEGTKAQEGALYWTVKYLVDIVEQQARTIERLDRESDAAADAKFFSGQRG